MALKLCCFRSPPSTPVQPPPALTPAFEDLPTIPNFNLDGAFCRPLRTLTTSATANADNTPVAAASSVDSERGRGEEEEEEEVEEEEGDDDLITTEPISRPRKHSVPLLYRKRAFPIPELDMVAGRTPASTWQAVAAKVVSANRLRRGLGKEVRIEDFKIEELGGRAGQSIFGPVSVFNGNVTFRVKKPLKGITVTVAFYGVTEVGGQFVNFITAVRDLYSGDMIQEGLRSFLFAFNFPHVNLPPTSDQPLISYSFSAKLAVDDRPDSRETLPFSHTTEIMEYRTKPLRITFIPYVDPSLETPLVSRKPSMRKKRSTEKNGLKKAENRSAYTINPPGSPASPTSPMMRGPKLTLTTADLPLSASSNSTPAIDKPHPSTLSSAIERTTRITDDDNNTIAKLTIEMPSSRFLPGENIAMKLTLQVRDGLPLPKGLGARVIETRSLAGESPDGEASEKEQGVEDDEPPKMKAVGKEQLRVLTGKKFILQHHGLASIKASDSESGSAQHQDTGMVGGKELVEMIMVTLPPFQTFISDSLLPTTTLPLGDPNADELLPKSPTPISPNPKIVYSGKGKSVDTSTTVIETVRLYFKVSHIVQITVPMNNGSSHWYNKAAILDDLEVTVPIILGNKDPQNRGRYKAPPELKLNAPDMGKRMFSSGEGGGSSISSRSNSRSSVSPSGDGGHGSSRSGWREGMKFSTLRDTDVRPDFVVD